MSVVRGKLQLVSTLHCIMLVSLYSLPTHDTYTKAQVLRMEQIILKILSLDFLFYNTYAVLYDIRYQVKFFAQYISELSLLEGNTYLVYVPSLVSAAALALARYILDFPIWCPELVEVTSFKLNDVKEIILHLSKTHLVANELAQQAIPDKYKDAKYWDEKVFIGVLEEYNQMLELQSENSLVAASSADKENTSTSK